MCYSTVIHNSLDLTIDLGMPFYPVINLFLYALIEIGLAASSFPLAFNKLRCCRPRARGREQIKMVGGMRVRTCHRKLFTVQVQNLRL